MPHQPANVLLCGLDSALAADLSACLHEHHVARAHFQDPARFAQRLSSESPDVVFCSTDRGVFSTLMNALRSIPRRIPVIAVSRAPEVSEWLDAMEAGAADYCGAPFETRDIDWILTASLRPLRQTAAA
jgi:DNA-binding NtrC family response regulator